MSLTPKQAIVTLAAAFKQETIKQETIDIYEKMLSDIPGQLLEESVMDILNRCKFFPSIAEIRETAARKCGLLPCSPAEALAIIKQADVAEPKYDRAGRYCYTERHWQWPDNVDRQTLGCIIDTLGKVGDPYGADGKAKFGWEQGFSKTYESESGIATQRVLADLKTYALKSMQRKELANAARTRRAVGDGSMPQDHRHA